MGWFTSKIWYFILIVVIAGIWIMLYQKSICREKGKKLGGSYKCGFFSKDPVSILPVDEYYDLSGGECFHYIDYGDRMSIRKVGMEKCN